MGGAKLLKKPKTRLKKVEIDKTRLFLKISFCDQKDSQTTFVNIFVKTI